GVARLRTLVPFPMNALAIGQESEVLYSLLRVHPRTPAIDGNLCDNDSQGAKLLRSRPNYFDAGFQTGSESQLFLCRSRSGKAQNEQRLFCLSRKADKARRAASSPAAQIYFPTSFRSASLILSCQPGPAS